MLRGNLIMNHFTDSLRNLCLNVPLKNPNRSATFDSLSVYLDSLCNSLTAISIGSDMKNDRQLGVRRLHRSKRFLLLCRKYSYYRV